MAVVCGLTSDVCRMPYVCSGVSTDTPASGGGAQDEEGGGGLGGQQRVSIVMRNGRWMGARGTNTAGSGTSHDQQMTEQRLMEGLAGVPGLQQGLQRVQARVRTLHYMCSTSAARSAQLARPSTLFRWSAWTVWDLHKASTQVSCTCYYR